MSRAAVDEKRSSCRLECLKYEVFAGFKRDELLGEEAEAQILGCLSQLLRRHEPHDRVQCFQGRERRRRNAFAPFLRQLQEAERINATALVDADVAARLEGMRRIRALARATFPVAVDQRDQALARPITARPAAPRSPLAGLGRALADAFAPRRAVP